MTPPEASPISTDGLGDGAQAFAVALGAIALGVLATTLWAQPMFLLSTAFTGSEPTDLHLLLLNPPALGLGMATGAVLYVKLAERDLDFFDVRVPTLRDLTYVAAGVVGLFVVIVIGSVLFYLFDVTAADHGTIEETRAADLEVAALLAGMMIVFVGPGEEVLFRNVVQKRLSEAFAPGVSIVLASVPFALLHFSSYPTGTALEVGLALGMTFSLSLVLGWIYHRTGSVVVPALAHGIYNALTVVMAYTGVAWITLVPW